MPRKTACIFVALLGLAATGLADGLVRKPRNYQGSLEERG